MSRFAIYVRVSTEEQVHGFSIDVQKDRLAAYCKSQGWDDPELYIDDGYTGTNMNRPALKRLIRNCNAGQISSVVVYKLDRLGRKQKDVLHLLEDVFEKNNVAFKSATEPFDTATSLGKAMLGVLAVFAQLERDMIIERTTTGRRERIKQGKWPGGPIPFGYDWNKETEELIVKPEEAHIVREIFNRYLKGHSRLSIAEWASARTTARKLDHAVIRDMLARQLYAGNLISGGQIVKGNHEAIIDKETWHRVQIESSRRKDDALPIGEYLLTGLLKCGVCGGNIVHVKRVTKKYGKEYLYELYACKKQHVRKKDRSENCTLGYQRRQSVEDFVIGELNDLAVKPKSINEVLERYKKSDSDIEVKGALNQKLAAVMSGIENLYDAIQAGAIKASSIGNRLAKLEEEREAIVKQLEDFGDVPQYKDKTEFQHSIKQINQAWAYMTMEEQKEALRMVVRTVVLNKGEKPEIVWNLLRE